MRILKILYNFRILFFLSFIILRVLPLQGQRSDPDSLKNKHFQKVQLLVNKDRIKAQTWWYGWIGGYSAATAGQGMVFLLSDKKATRQDMALGAATTLLGAIGTLITPIVPRKSTIQGSGIIINDSTGKIQESNDPGRLLKEIALREKAGKSWKIHAVAGVVNISSGLITWLGFKRTFRDGLLNFALNTVITETQILTQPARAIRDYQNYCNNYNALISPTLQKPEKRWILSCNPGGIALRLDF